MLLLRSSGRLAVYTPPFSQQHLFNIFDGLLDDSLLNWSRVRVYAFGREDFLAIPRVNEEASKKHGSNKGGGHDAKSSPLRRHLQTNGLPLTHFAFVLIIDVVIFFLRQHDDR